LEARPLHIRLVVVGREAPFLRRAVAEYAGRLGHYAQVEVLAVTAATWPIAPGPAQVTRLLAEEAERVRRVWRGERRVLLARDGRERTSEELAAWLGALERSGTRSLALLVGGPGGVAADVAAEADERWSLGAATLAHTLAAVVVLEQVYRAYRILRGEPYHH
jgi:23S rRNA (pseudouridine1915-N3)-methyltransferase